MKPGQGTHADASRLRFTQARIAESLRTLDRARQGRARAAADTLIDCLRTFVEAGHVPLAAVVGGNTDPRIWEQYQPDAAAAMDGTPGHLHYYYHSHATPGASPAEHGHFHLFAQLGADEEGVPRYSHLVAIGVDAIGMPRRLFTTNRWVTNENWLPAERSIALAEHIVDTPANEEDAVERWLRAQLGVFAPQIAALLRHRDDRMAARMSSGHRPGLLEDRRMHVISQCQVSVERQLTALDRVIH